MQAAELVDNLSLALPQCCKVQRSVFSGRVTDVFETKNILEVSG